MPPNLGGLGAINIERFLTAQGCGWVKRAFNLCIDNWRFDLTSSCPDNNILALRSSYLNPVVSPILHYLAGCYEKFYISYTEINDNFREAYVFENTCFKRSRVSSECIDSTFFGRDFFEANKAKICTLKFSDFFSDGRVKDLAAIRDAGLPITVANWLALQAAGSLAWSTMKKHTTLEERVAPIENTFRRNIKGSRYYKNILEKKNISEADPNSLRITQSFADLTETEVQSVEITMRCLGGWNIYATENLFREFVFKRRNNQLKTNNRLNAFDPDIDPRCSFCRIIDRDSNTRETFGHIFFSCPVTYSLLNNLATHLEPRLDLETELFKDLYWYGRYDDNTAIESSLLLFFDTVRYLIWKFRCRRKIPNWNMLAREIKFTLECVFNLNQSLRTRAEAANIISNLLPARG